MPNDPNDSRQRKPQRSPGEPFERSIPGSETSSRLLARAMEPGLSRRTFGSGSEVYEGPLATQALKAVGARAMTLDRSIIVGEDFDPSKPESQALYAHERVHVVGSGGEGGHDLRDAEEVAARSMESMVLHRARSGAGLEQLPDASQVLRAGGDASAAPMAAARVGDEKADPGKGYAILHETGLGHEEIVERLKQECVQGMNQEEQDQQARFGGDNF